MVAFIDAQRMTYGVESICRQLPIAPSTYYEHKAREQKPDRVPDRLKRDQKLEMDVRRIWEVNLQVYGGRKLWRQINREGLNVARYTVEPLMKQFGHPGCHPWRQMLDDTSR
jgi:putative transposase